MSPQLSVRRAPRRGRLRRLAMPALLAISLFVLAGCGTETEGERLAMPKPLTVEGESNLALWQGAWIAALITGAVVWGLIFYAVWHYRRRSDDEVPIQTRYNLPLEIFYTIFPIIMVIVLFDHTIKTQDILLADADSAVDNTVYVVGQQWSWTFNYPDSEVTGEDGQPVTTNIYEFGTADYVPTLVLPVDQTTRFELRSPDVIHDFGVPGFLMKMDVVPGHPNRFQATPKVEGTQFKGACFELCGAYHARMIFYVDIVSESEYQEYLQAQYDKGYHSPEPLCGGGYASTQAGLGLEGENDEDYEGACQQ